MKAIILARVSTEEQKEAGNSLPAQVERLKNYCRQKGFSVLKTYSFDESAYKTKRDDFDKILMEIRASKEKLALCFDKVDRFSRNVFDKRVSELYELATTKGKIELHFASDNLVISENMSAVEKFHFGVGMGLSKYYSDAIGDNVKRAFESKIKKGEWTSKAPIGYKNIRDERGGGDVIPDELRAPFIKKMFEMYATGNQSMLAIRNKISEMGLRSKGGIPLPKSGIDNILRNPFYYGMMKIKGHIYPHKHQPLISKDLFDKVQQVKAGYHKKPFQYAAKPFIFRGMIKCADCGCMISPELTKGKYIYYSCTNYKKAHKKRVYVSEADILEPVEKLLKGIVLSDERISDLTAELKKINENKNHFHRQAIEGLRTEYDKIDKRASAMYDDKLDGSITNEMFDKKLREYKERQSELNDQLQRHTDADENFYLIANQVMSLAQRAYAIFSSKETEINEKRALLNFLLQNCQLSGKNLTYTLRKPFDAMFVYNQSIVRASELQNMPYLSTKSTRSVDGLCANLGDLDSNQDSQLQRLESYH